MKKNKFTKSYLAWLKKASEDELSAAWLVESKKGSSGTVCFLSQQMVEKILKAFLIYNGATLKRIHDLLELQNLVSQYYPTINGLGEDFKVLNDFYIESRYPGEIEFTWKLAEKGLKSAQKIKQFILDYFEQHESNGN